MFDPQKLKKVIFVKNMSEVNNFMMTSPRAGYDNNGVFK